MNTDIVFMGSPDFALPVFKKMIENFNVVGVVTQPDRPAGRGRQLTPPPVKILAKQHNLPVIQPESLKDNQAMQQLRDWDPDLIVVAAFGQILRSEVLELPMFGCVNVHASLLPRWRGAAPIQASILHGDEKTGVTIMKMDPGLDTGPVLSQRATDILPGETAGELSSRLADLGAELLAETLPSYLNGNIQPEIQNDSLATYAPRLNKSDGELDFNKSATDLERQVRAFSPWPGAFTYWQGGLLKIHQAHASTSQSPGRGITTSEDGIPAFGTVDGLLVLDVVQPAGKRVMKAKAFLAGAKEWIS